MCGCVARAAGFGAVFATSRLHSLAREGPCAIKRMHVESSQGVSEFENEIRLLATLHHPNLLPLLGCCEDGDVSCLIYPLMPGE